MLRQPLFAGIEQVIQKVSLCLLVPLHEERHEHVAQRGLIVEDAKHRTLVDADHYGLRHGSRGRGVEGRRG